MPETTSRVEDLKHKYGPRGVEAALRLRPFEFPQMLEWRDELDQNYAKLWFDYTYGGLIGRGVLDDRTRLLVLIGECVCLDAMEELEGQIRSALVVGVPPREVLEVILQATIYVGVPHGVKGARIFRGILKELGREDEITQTQLPLDGRAPQRSLEEERLTWRVPDERFPRREELMQKYGWRGISTFLRLQPTHHVQWLERLDRLDQNFTKTWLDFGSGMYERQVLDDKTRLLVMVGDCISIGEFGQGENHIRCALLLGATPREVLEVLLHSTVYAGMPRPLTGVVILERVLDEQGRIGELTETQLPLP